MFLKVVDVVGTSIDAAGVTVIAADRLRRRVPDTYRRYRQQLGRSFLLGLEMLVAADIIRTVAVAPTVTSVSLLAGIVLIRTFLSFSLELEITGRWPWQKPDPAPATRAPLTPRRTVAKVAVTAVLVGAALVRVLTLFEDVYGAGDD